MKIDIDDLEQIYDICIASGGIKEKQAIDIELIKSLKQVAVSGLNSRGRNPPLSSLGMNASLEFAKNPS